MKPFTNKLEFIEKVISTFPKHRELIKKIIYGKCIFDWEIDNFNQLVNLSNLFSDGLDKSNLFNICRVDLNNVIDIDRLIFINSKTIESLTQSQFIKFNGIRSYLNKSNDTKVIWKDQNTNEGIWRLQVNKDTDVIKYKSIAQQFYLVSIDLLR